VTNEVIEEVRRKKIVVSLLRLILKKPMIMWIGIS